MAIAVGLLLPWGLQAESHWSFGDLRRPPVPETASAPSTGNPIDAFIDARLSQQGIRANAPATRTTLIRRATYDLWGLPPSPADVEAFVNDPAPDAFHDVVERLLASPHYGEKWGRHWLDLVRFAETNSYERDTTKPNAWRYRDYVIDSLNEDKPYDQFIREQLAGDEMRPRTKSQLVATGFYRLGLWDDEPADETLALYDELDDVLTVTSQVFLGLTLNCARCHDHKLDPIPQADYYRMLSFFAGVDRYGGPGRGRDHAYAQVPLLSPDEAAEHARANAAHRERLAEIDGQLTELSNRLQAKLTGGAVDDFAHEQSRLAIVRKFIPTLFSETDAIQLGGLLDQKRHTQESGPADVGMALAVREAGPEPRPMSVLTRGNPHAAAESVMPGYPRVLGFSDPAIPPRQEGDTCGRRTVLANWIASPANPLTARVIANRVWQYHFGTGIVATPNDFGLQGARPTHPALLDWLASELIDHQWSLKHLHRKIMHSQAYQRSSTDQPDALAKDTQNHLWWRFPMRRLTAEEFRDSLLVVTQSLNPKRGGPSFYPEIEDEVKAGQSRPGEGWGTSDFAERQRRSIYIFAKRSLMTPILATLDAAEPDFSCPVRFATTTPTQSLTMMNGRYVRELAGRLAELAAQKHATHEQQVRWILAQVTQQPARDEDVARGVRLIDDLTRLEQSTPRQALDRFCVVALNLNEFLYLD